MKNFENWDAKFRQELHEASETPPSHVWDKIASGIDQMPQKSNKSLRFLLVGFCLFLTIGTGIAIGYKYISNDAAQPIQTEVISEPSKSEISQNDSKTDPDVNTIDNNDLEDVPNIHMSQTNNFSVRQNKKADFRQTQDKKDLNTYLTKETDSHIKSKSINAGRAQTTLFSSNEIVENKEINQSVNSNQLLTPHNYNKENSSIQSGFSKIPEINDMKNLPAITSLLTYDISDIKISLLPKKRKVVCPSFQTRRALPFLEVKGGAGNVFKTMTHTSTEPGNWLVKRLATESPWYSWHGGIAGGVELRNGLTFSIGGEFVQIKEKFSFEKDGLTQIVINIDPETNLPIDTTYVTGKLVSKGEVRHSLINIPAAIGYNASFGDWILNPEIGAGFNVYKTQEGKIILADDKISRLENHDFFKNSVGINLNAGVALHRVISDNTSAFVKPIFQYYLSEWNQNSTNPIEQKYNRFSLEAGIRVRLTAN